MDADASTRAYVQRDRARAALETADRILDAVVTLFVDTAYAKITLDAVADLAGVTVRTVIRRFGDKEGLVAAAAERESAAVARQREHAPVGDLPAIVANLVDHYETTGALALRLLAEEDVSDTIAAVTRAGRALHRHWCLRVFDPFLSGLSGIDHDRRAAQLVAVCDVYTWKLLRHDAGLDREQTSTAMLELLEPLTGRH